MKIIPAIDIIQGKCVRLTKGDYDSKKVYAEDPVAMAQSFEDAGITHLHLVDLDGAKAGRVVNLEVLRKIAESTNLVVDFGGGIKSSEDLKRVLESGAAQVTLGSVAVKNKPFFLEALQTYGSDKIILGADVKEGYIAINGWQETSELELFRFLGDYIAEGIEYVICTDISKDGMLSGSSIELYKKIIAQHPQLKLIASGGVTSLEEIKQLEKEGVYGAIIGKALYEGRLMLHELT